jgi:hypothetical protein
VLNKALINALTKGLILAPSKALSASFA